MVSKKENKYYPNFAIPPGESIQELIEVRNMTQVELAKCMDISQKIVNDIIKGETDITPEIAIKLEHALDVPASFWNNLENNYRNDLARQ